MTTLNVPTDVPIALFPVRLETRFTTEPDGDRVLLIRIYPDEITMTAHESAMTEAEIEDAKHFWGIYHGSHSQETVESTWEQLSRAYGPERTAYIVRQLEPITVEPLDFQTPTPKSESWTQPPRAAMLPTRWRAIGIVNGVNVFNVVSEPIASELAAGPDPDNPDLTDPTSPAHWMVSFQKAREVGMGIKVAESGSWNYDDGLDKLIVVGVREDANTTTTRDALSAHFENRVFEDHFGFLAPGTPTNHIEGARADDDPNEEMRYLDIATRDSLFFQPDTDAERVQQALGLDGVSEHPMAYARGAQQRNSDAVSVVHQILWPATWGYFLEHIIQLDRQPSEAQSGSWVSRGWGNMEEVYWRYLRPDGPLPTLRVGDQPYGVLPATSIEQWTNFYKQVDIDDDGQNEDVPVGPTDETLNVIRQLRDGMFAPQVQGVPKLGQGSHPHQDFVAALQQGPRPTGLRLRGIVTQTAYEELARTLRWPASADADAKTLEQNIEALLDGEYGLFGSNADDADLDFRPEADHSPGDTEPYANEPRLARLMPLCVRSNIAPVLVQVPEEEVTGDTFGFPSYLSWLADASYNDIQNDPDWENRASGGEPLPLFAILARHSCMQVLYATALRFMTLWGVKDAASNPVDMAAFEPDIHNLPEFEPDTNTYGSPALPSESIWDWLDTPLADVIEDTPYDDPNVSSTHTLRDFLELVRLDPLAAANGTAPYYDETGDYSGIDGLFDYRIARSFIRFWLNMFIFSDGPSGARLQKPAVWDYGQKLHEDLVAIDGRTYLSAPRLPYGFEAGNLSVEETERILLSALSTSSDRLDAWVTALATQRLDHLDGSGIGYGGYGYVEDLKPSFSAPSAGYVHAPSLGQAHTAAVLKSAHLTYEVEEGTGDNAAAIDLSSARVRQAKKLIEGVRQGQPLGALLGYRLERRLRERSGPTLNLLKLVSPLRDAYAERVTRLTGTNPDTPAARTVVDGLQVIRDDTADIDNLLQAYGATQNERNAALEELEHVRQMVDATEDLLLAEAVHQIVQGNPSRALASLNAQNRAGLPPDQFDVVDTPRTGTTVTHRAIVLLDASGTPQAGSSARSKAAPRLNIWLEGLLGLDDGISTDISCQIGYTLDDGTTVTYFVTLDELLASPDFNLEAIDLLYLLPESDTGQQTTLDAYVRYVVGQKTGDMWPTRDPSKPITIDYTVADSGQRSFRSFFDVVSSIKDVVASARPLTGQDLEHPEREASPALNFFELESRTDQALNDLSASSGLRYQLTSHLIINTALYEDTTDEPDRRSHAAELLGVSSDADLSVFDSFVTLPPQADIRGLVTFLDLPSPTDIELLRTTLLDAAEYGVSSAAPLSVSATSPDDRLKLVKQGVTTYRDVERKVQALPDNPTDQVDIEIQRLRGVFGDDFQPLPSIDQALADYDHQATYAGLTATSLLLNNRESAAFGWLGQVGRVRPRMQSVQDAISLADLVLPESTLASPTGFGPLRVGQLPLDAGDPDLPPTWVAISDPMDVRNAVSYLVVDTDGAVSTLDPQATDPVSLAGLVIDEWNEVIPSQEETTGVAFHYDRPATRPPQSMLLAVAPEVGGSSPEWSDTVLADIVEETFEMAKMRGVDSATIADVPTPDQPGELLQFLPALLFPDYGDDTPPSVHVDYSSYL